ncbi:MAG: hypothetical protein QF619_10450 [Candidatus Binatia bacterium]|jgi:hypothetical protein|nr:hypothetical protein [Candidatus Binatia bacterium]
MLSGRGIRSLFSTGPDVREQYKRTGKIFLWIQAIAGGIILVGYRVTFPLFGFLYSRKYGAGLKLSLFIALLAEGSLLLIFDQLLHLILPTPLFY